MAKLGRKKGAEVPPEHPDGEQTPAYLRPRFVIGVVVLCLLLGFVMYRLGSSGGIDLESEQSASNPVVDVEDEAAPPSTDPADCPPPGEPVELEAAELLRVFQAAVADPEIGAPPASDEVEAQLEAAAPSPVLSRMTRIRGFVGGTGSWSTCVLSYWMGSEGPMRSLDVVTLAVVSGSDDSSSDDGNSDGSDSDSDEDSDGEQGDDGDERWEVTRWLRGEPVPTPRTRAVPVMYFNGSGCSNPNREVSVTIPDGSAEDRIRGALEELASGSVGRSPTATTLVPADVQVEEVSVQGNRARIVLTPTLESLSGCEGRGAYAQVSETAEAVLADAVDPAGDPDVDVEIVIDGESVDTLRN